MHQCLCSGQLLRQCKRVQVATVDGMVDLKIPAGTQPGTTLVMAKRGVPRLGSSTVRGDHQVRHCVAAARVLFGQAASATRFLQADALTAAAVAGARARDHSVAAGQGRAAPSRGAARTAGVKGQGWQPLGAVIAAFRVVSVCLECPALALL